jgi:hypothetical protein
VGAGRYLYRRRLAIRASEDKLAPFVSTKKASKLTVHDDVDIGAPVKAQEDLQYAFQHPIMKANWRFLIILSTLNRSARGSIHLGQGLQYMPGRPRNQAKQERSK